MAKTPPPIEVEAEWYDAELEAAAKAREGMEWQEWERQMIRHYAARKVGANLLSQRLNARRDAQGLQPRTLSSVRCAITRFKDE